MVSRELIEKKFASTVKRLLRLLSCEEKGAQDRNNVVCSTLINSISDVSPEQFETISKKYADSLKAKSLLLSFMVNVASMLTSTTQRFDVDEKKRGGSICNSANNTNNVDFIQTFTQALIYIMEEVVTHSISRHVIQVEDKPDWIIARFKEVGFVPETENNRFENATEQTSISWPERIIVKKKKVARLENHQKSGHQNSLQYAEYCRCVEHNYTVLIESLQLRCMSQTTKGLFGRKRVFELYQMPAPTRPVHNNSAALDRLKHAIATEFLALHKGVNKDCTCRIHTFISELDSDQMKQTHFFTSPIPTAVAMVEQIADNKGINKKEPRHRLSSVLYLQLNIGLPNKLEQRQNIKDPSREYVAVLRPGSSMVALTAAGRPPSSVTSTSFILAVIGTALCSLESLTQVAKKSSHRMKKVVSERLSFHKHFEGLSGSDPLALLQAAQTTMQKSAVGRFKHHISIISNTRNDSRQALSSKNKAGGNPLLELHAASTDCGTAFSTKGIVCGVSDESNITTLPQHSRESKSSKNKNCSSFVDYSASSRVSQKRQRNEELGAVGDCPRMEKISWKWNGHTCAAHNSFRHSYDAGIKDEQEPEITPMIKFKCGVRMEGSDVFEGLRAVVASGMSKSLLPDFVRNAPMLGANSITVNSDGSYYRDDENQ